LKKILKTGHYPPRNDRQPLNYGIFTLCQAPGQVKPACGIRQGNLIWQF